MARVRVLLFAATVVIVMASHNALLEGDPCLRHSPV